MVQVSLPTVVVADDAPVPIQGMATDINDTFSRLSRAVAALQAAVEELQTEVAAIQANDAVHGSGAYGY